jgi:hypothetical protein
MNSQWFTKVDLPDEWLPCDHVTVVEHSFDNATYAKAREAVQLNTYQQQDHRTRCDRLHLRRCTHRSNCEVVSRPFVTRM